MKEDKHLKITKHPAQPEKKHVRMYYKMAFFVLEHLTLPSLNHEHLTFIFRYKKVYHYPIQLISNKLSAEQQTCTEHTSNHK